MLFVYYSLIFVCIECTFLFIMNKSIKYNTILGTSFNKFGLFRCAFSLSEIPSLSVILLRYGKGFHVAI